MSKAAVSIWVGALPVALAGLMVSVAHPHLRGASDLCSVIIMNPYLRSERETYLIGSARSDTVRVRISDVPGVLPSERHPYRDSTPVFGQVLRVRGVYGANADRVLAGTAARDSTVVLIPYGMNSMCQTFPERVWLDTGFVDHFTVFLRPDSEWAAGRPTFDILAGYPPYLRRKRDADFDSTLTVDEYASLVKVLPIDTDWGQDCPKGLARIATWAQSHELRSALYPANEVIRVMQWDCDRIRRVR